MEYTTADIWQGIGILLAIGMSLLGLRKSRREAEQLEATTAKLYADMSADCAERERKMSERITELTQTLIDFQLLDYAKKKEIKNLRQEVTETKTQLAEMEMQLKRKDSRIEELERLSQKQEARIIELETEITYLRLQQTPETKK